MIRAALLALAIAAPAHALNVSGSTIILQPSDEPGAIAEVVFSNVSTNTMRDEARYDLALDGLTVSVLFRFNVNPDAADQIVVTPPAGIVCDPEDCTATLLEGFSGRVVLFEFVGM